MALSCLSLPGSCCDQQGHRWALWLLVAPVWAQALALVPPQLDSSLRLVSEVSTRMSSWKKNSLETPCLEMSSQPYSVGTPNPVPRPTAQSRSLGSSGGGEREKETQR